MSPAMPRLQGKQLAEERLNLTMLLESALHTRNQQLTAMLALVMCQQHAVARSAAVATKDSALQVAPALPIVVHAKISVPGFARLLLTRSARVPFNCMMTLCVQLCQCSERVLLTAT